MNGGGGVIGTMTGRPQLVFDGPLQDTTEISSFLKLAVQEDGGSSFLGGQIVGRARVGVSLSR